MPEVDSSKVRLLIRNPPFCRLTTSRHLTRFRRYLPLYQTACHNSFLTMKYSIDVTLLCKGFFTLGSVVAIGGVLVPSFRTKIMNYGTRATNTDTKPEEPVKQPKSNLASLLDFVASFQVPHTWFTHFYVVSLISSIFWGVQILTHGRVISFITSHHQVQGTSGMTINQVFLAWGFMALQGARRLYESIILAKPSQSKMWIGHWLIGIAYYVFIGISVWIEGICK